MTARERAIHNHLTSEVHDEDYDRMLFVVDSDDYPDEAQFRAAQREAGALADRYGIPREVEQQAYPPPTAKNGPRWERLRDALEGDGRPVVYYALLLPGGTRENPSGVLRRVRGPRRVLGYSVGADGRWRPTDALIDRAVRGTAVGDIEELAVEEAATVLERWRAGGVVSVVLDADDSPQLRDRLGSGPGGGRR